MITDSRPAKGVAAPDLEPHCGSWIVSDANGNFVWETFQRASADRAVQAGWIVETASQYLGRINKRNGNAKRQ